MGKFLKDDAVNSGAEEVGCSPLTTKRYLQKLSSSGVFVIDHGYRNAERVFMKTEAMPSPNRGDYQQ